MRKKSVNNAQLTKLEAERQSKALARELEEQLDATGQDSETAGAKAVMELHKEEQAEEQQKKEVERFLLEESRKRKLTYWQALVTVCRRQMGEYDLPKGFIWGAFLKKLDNNECGLVVWFRSDLGQRAEVAMKISGEPKFDVNWIDRRIPDTLDVIEKIDAKNNPVSKGGIHLPS